MSRKTALACGWTHTILISDRGQYYGWGIGESGQLGSEKGFVKFGADALSFGEEVRPDPQASVAVGSHHSLILSGGRVFSMGSPLNGRLGHNKTHGRIDFPNEESYITFIAAGSDFSLAIGESPKNIYAWGLGIYGNLGDGDVVDRETPVLFHLYDARNPSVKKSVASISCGSRHSIAVCDDGDVYSWGNGQNGRLGHGNTESYAEPKRIEDFVLSADQRVTEIAAGDSHSMALTKEGRVYTWGSGSYGRLGLGADSDQYIPKVVEELREYTVTSVACNTFHCLALIDTKGTNKSSLWVWGGGKYGKLGLGDEENQSVPVEVPFFRKAHRQVISAQCGLHHTVAITIRGRVYAWGYSAKYRCGIKSPGRVFFDTPQIISFFDKLNIASSVRERELEMKVQKEQPKAEDPKAEMVAAGRAHSIALANGKLFGWGDNQHGQLGTGFHKDSLKPIPITISTQRKIIFVACGGRHSIALEEWGSVYTWGNNSSGQLGIGTLTTANFPTLVEALQGTKISHVYAGDSHSAAVDNSGNDDTARAYAYVWGNNQYGQLGLGRRSKQQVNPAPLVVKKGVKYHRIEMALGHTHTLILCSLYRKSAEAPKSRKRGRLDMASENSKLMDRLRETPLFVCGANTHGQLGLRQAAASDIKAKPVQVTEFEGWTPTNEFSAEQRGNKLPFIKSINAGEHNSLAIVLHERLEELYAWGTLPGLEPSRRIVPRRAEEFDHDQIQAKLILGNSIHHLTFLNVSSASNHFLVLLRYNKDRKVLFSWGETKYGKLGVGNIAKYNEELEDAKALRKKYQRSSRHEEEEETKSVSYLNPAIVATLSDKDVATVSCSGEHCLATTKTGTVYAWGYGNNGRLGLGASEDALKSQQEPVVVPSFYSAEHALGMDEDSDEEDDDLIVEYESDDDMTEEQKKAKEARKVRDERAKRLADEYPEEAAALLHEDMGPEDIEICAALSPKYMPKERFAVIEQAQRLLSRKQGQFQVYMDKYLQNLDARERTEEIVKLAIEKRLKQARLVNRNLRKIETQKMRDEKEQLAEDKKKKKTKKDKKKKKKIKAGNDTIEVFGNDLTSLEETIGRFYMAPCLFKDLYDKCSVYLREPTMYAEAEERLTQDFVNVIFSVYDSEFASDMRLLQNVLGEILKAHIYRCKRPEEVLARGSLEWMVFLETFRRGGIRRKLRHFWEKPFTEMKVPNIRDPCEHLRNYITAPDEMETKLEGSLNSLVDMGHQLFNYLTVTAVSELMSIFGWVVEILVDAFKASNKEPGNIVGVRTITALAIVAMEDVEGRYRRSHNTGRINHAISAYTERFLLFLLMEGSTEKIRDHLAETYQILDESLIPNGLASFWNMDGKGKKYRDPNIQRGVEAYLTHVENDRAREQAQALKEGRQDEDPLMKKERLLMRDFIFMRTTHHRRVIQLPHSCRRLLMVLDHFPEDDRFSRGTTNLRLDPFNTDRHKECIRCSRCGVFHPPVTYPDAAQGSTSQPELLDGPVIDDADVKNQVIISAKACSEMWRTLQEREFQEIVEEKAGEGAWKELMRALKKRRHRAFENEKFAKVARYESTSRNLRKIKDAPQGTIVYLGGKENPAIQEMSDPARLFETLQAIDEKAARNEQLAIRNVELYMDAVTILRKKVDTSEEEVKEVRNVFAHLIGSKKDRNLKKIKMRMRKQVKGAEFRKTKRIHVYKERGSMQKFSYWYLRDEGILEADPDPLNEPEQLLCLPLTWFLMFRTSARQRNQILFYDKVEFVFSTTESDDIFKVKIVYGAQLLAFSRISLAIITKDAADEEMQHVAKEEGVRDDCHQIEYQPQGDRVPVSHLQTFVFNRENLSELLDQLPRAHNRQSGRGQAERRSVHLANLLKSSTADTTI